METDAIAGCSKQIDSSEVQEYICSECFKSGKRTEASHYCPSCDTFYCKPCLCDHDVLGRSNVKQWDGSKRRKTEELCVRHPREAVLLFCKSHDELCCRLCLSSTRHRFCTERVELKSLKDEISSREDTRNILDVLSRVADKAKILQEDRCLRCKTVESTYSICLKRLGEFRKSVNSAFDEIEVKLSKYRHEYIGRFRGDQAVCANTLAQLEAFKQQLSNAGHHNTTYDLKKCKDWSGYTDENFVEMNRIAIKDAFVPISVSDIENTVQTINKLGEIRFTFFSFSAKTDEDMNICEIGGMCQMPDGSIVIADKGNQKLKKFDTDYQAICYCEFEPGVYPNDVCCVNDTKVAVTTNNSKIQMVSVGTTLEVIRSITVNRNIYYIAYLNNMFYCQNDTMYSLGLEVCSYDMDGKQVCIKSIGIETRQDAVPITLSKKMCRLYSVLKDNCVIVFNIEGLEIKESQRVKLCATLKGVCADDDRFLYVSDSSNKQIQKLDINVLESAIAIPDTQLTSIDIPLSPGSLCYDKRYGRVFVACLNSNTVFVV